MFDLHCHSEFSMDSRESMESSVRVGINRNLKSICFTDHIDFFPEDWSKTYAFVPKDYFRSLNRVRYTYADKIEVLAGCELGMVRGIADEYDAYIRDYPFDYVLLSLHTLKSRDIAYEWASFYVLKFPPVPAEEWLTVSLAILFFLYCFHRDCILFFRDVV